VLFNSYTFIVLFLPLVLAVFYLLGRRMGPMAAISWLTLASLFFYGWWNPRYLLLILSSIGFNYLIAGRLLADERSGRRRMLLVVGISLNLLVLCYFKYAGFMLENVNALLRTEWQAGTILLPLAISFFTFQQITYLIDAYRDRAESHGFIRYALFVTFFPQLIAGPIVHHSEMMPQFRNPAVFRFNHENLSVGMVIFLLGMFKKVVIADTLALQASPVFAAAEGEEQVVTIAAWIGVLSYTFQLYFDFSGYSDMAIGLARMFGIHLPINFNSPYKSASIIEFWRRWHMTLSRFLRDYLYIPFGGNRHGPLRRHVSILLTMLLGGLWHGASWTFVAWGLLHGTFLVINHLWRGASEHWLLSRPLLAGLWRIAAHVLTFFCVLAGWVLFRAESFDGALNIYRGMFTLHGFNMHELQVALRYSGMLMFAATLAFFAPNVQQFMQPYRPPAATLSWPATRPASPAIVWRPTRAWAWGIALSGVVIFSQVTSVSEFLYFQF
jgi:D-alanyl-lipoteichoic acid acyltransferase DltB (MBOAT superfamily)